jgi:hypothetical protein
MLVTQAQPVMEALDEMTRGHIFSRVRPSYERAVSNLDRSMHISLWVYAAHSLFIEGSHMTKNTASVNERPSKFLNA